MKKQTRSILSELLSDTNENLDSKIESRFSHCYNSAMNFMSFLKDNKNLTEAQKNDLIKRFILAVKSNDPKKFTKGLRELKDK